MMMNNSNNMIRDQQIIQERELMSEQCQNRSASLKLCCSKKGNENQIINLNKLLSKTTQELITIILKKDQQIKKLTEALQNIPQQQSPQKPHQIQCSSRNQQVAQQQTQKNNNCFQQRKLYMMKQKIGLMKQVNQRLFGENQQMEKCLTKANREIVEIREQMKAQESAYSIKMAEMKLELGEERRIGKQHRREITMLKAIIKELQEELQEEEQDQGEGQDQDEGDYKKHSEKSSNNTTDMSSDQKTNDQTSNTNSIATHHHHSQNKRCSSESMTNFTQRNISNQPNNDDLQQSDIVFAEA